MTKEDCPDPGLIMAFFFFFFIKENWYPAFIFLLLKYHGINHTKLQPGCICSSMHLLTRARNLNPDTL